jgi:D-mannonate dehydratase
LHSAVDAVVADDGMILPEDTLITFAEDKVKTVCHNYRQVIPVIRTDNANGSSWTTLTKAEVKRF